jgi:anti-sigma factor RsiW
MDCQTLDEKLYELVEGSLDAATRDAAQAHTAGCTKCAQSLAEYRETVRLLAVTKHPEMPEAFWARQRERVMVVVRRALEVRPWQAPPYSLVMLFLIVAGYVYVGLDVMGGMADDAGARSVPSSTVHLTLIPLYAFMLVLAGLTFRDRPDEQRERR